MKDTATNTIITRKKEVDFIPANESRFLVNFFHWYTRLLMKLRFKSVNVYQKYKPTRDSRTVYYLNHNYWWDGLIPLYLAEKHFNQKARALMEDKQMMEYRFFSRIGAFSVNLNDPRSTITSLRYALESMERDRASLFVYPEGEIFPVSNKTNEFKDGLAWLYQNSTGLDFVPIAIYIDHSKSNRPDLNILVGESLDFSNSLSRKELTSLFKSNLDDLLAELRTRNHQVHS